MSCNICMEPIVNDIFTTSCKHNFHNNKCMVPWMLTHNTCPCCRRELGTDPKPIQKKYVVQERKKRLPSYLRQTSWALIGLKNQLQFSSVKIH